MISIFLDSQVLCLSFSVIILSISLDSFTSILIYFILYKPKTASNTLCISKWDLFCKTVNYKHLSYLKSNLDTNYKASSAVIGQPSTSDFKLLVCSLIKRDKGTSRCNLQRFLHTYTTITSQCRLSLLNLSEGQVIKAESG